MLAAVVLLTSCASDTTGVGSPGFGSIRVAPTWSRNAARAPITLNRVEAIVERITVDSSTESSSSDTLTRTSRTFNPSDEELRLSLRVPLQGSSELLTVTLSYYADQTLLFVGSQEVEVSTGGSSTSAEPEMFYVGPGSNASGLIIEPFDTTVTAGSSTPFRATAINGQEQDVGPFYMRWSLSSSASGASIDAAGVLHAPSQPGTLWVRGNLPNGVDDSVQVTVTGTPASIVILSGDHQSGSPNNALAAPLVVAVRTSDGAGIPGVTVNWAATVGGGQMDEDVSVTDGEGVASNIAILGVNPGINVFTASVPGAGSVTFSANESQTGATITWQGNVSSAWSNGANWIGGVVPGVLDSAVINSVEFSPVLDTTPSLGALTLKGNSTLTIADHGLIVVRNLTLLDNSTLEMVSGNDFVVVGGNAVFDGGDSRGHLVAGVISISGDFTQRSSNSPMSFSASGEHIVSLVGQHSTVSFASPGEGTGTSGFQDFAWSLSAVNGTLTLNSNVVVRRSAVAGIAGTSTISSSDGQNLRAAQLATSGQIPLVFNNVTLTLQDTVAADYFLSQLTFQNMPTDRAQLTINYTGGSFTLNQVIFSTTPVAPNGVYLDATDSQVGDGSSLQVRVQNPTPASMGTFFREGGDAEIIWPYSPPP
jgi:hypothetical protein